MIFRGPPRQKWLQENVYPTLRHIVYPLFYPTSTLFYIVECRRTASSNRFAPLDESPSPAPKVWSRRVKIPIVAMPQSSDVIHIGHRFGLTDTHSVSSVKKDLSVSDLSKLTTAKSLQKIIGGKIVISSTRPAMKETAVRAETTIEEVLKRMRKSLGNPDKEKVEYETVEDKFIEYFNFGEGGVN